MLDCDMKMSLQRNQQRCSLESCVFLEKLYDHCVNDKRTTLIQEYFFVSERCVFCLEFRSLVCKFFTNELLIETCEGCHNKCKNRSLRNIPQ